MAIQTVIVVTMCVLVILSSLSSSSSSSSSSTLFTVNVLSLGAKPDGKSDSSSAFLTAWERACSSPSPATIIVPSGNFYIKKAEFGGLCRSSSVEFRIAGTLIAPSDYNVIGSDENWISFSHVDGVTISGGVIDGQGSSLWSCKRSGKNNCPSGATSLGFWRSKNIKVRKLTSINSQMFHIVVDGCDGVTMEGVKVRAAKDSPNTDGIHVQASTNVAILGSDIGTGDDCVSIGPGTNGLHVENIVCGPGHGVSIGSLGKDRDEPGVQNVTVRWASFYGTQNGLRIKSWGRPSTGYAHDVSFEHATMDNVDNPILIDQNYCPDHHEGCPSSASGVKISRVSYRDVHGTSATEVAVRFDCSASQPCTQITLEDVKLTYNHSPAEASCSHADGYASGFVQPSSCL